MISGASGSRLIRLCKLSRQNPINFYQSLDNLRILISNLNNFTGSCKGKIPTLNRSMTQWFRDVFSMLNDFPKARSPMTSKLQKKNPFAMSIGWPRLQLSSQTRRCGTLSSAARTPDPLSTEGPTPNAAKLIVNSPVVNHIERRHGFGNVVDGSHLAF